MEQIYLNFDASQFDGYESCREFLSHCTHRLKDEQGRPVLQKVIAADLDYSPTHWSQKIAEAGDSRVTLNDAEKYAEKFGDVEWINYLVYKHIIKKGRNIETLKKLRAELDKQLEGVA